MVSLVYHSQLMYEYYFQPMKHAHRQKKKVKKEGCLNCAFYRIVKNTSNHSLTNGLVFLSRKEYAPAKKSHRFDEYQAHWCNMDFNYYEDWKKKVRRPRSYSRPVNRVNVRSRHSVITGMLLRMEIERPVARSDTARHMRVACNRRICSRRRRCTVARTALLSFPIPTLAMNPWSMIRTCSQV